MSPYTHQEHSKTSYKNAQSEAWNCVCDNMRFIQGKKKTDKSGVIMIISEYIV